MCRCVSQNKFFFVNDRIVYLNIMCMTVNHKQQIKQIQQIQQIQQITEKFTVRKELHSSLTDPKKK